MGKLRWEGLVAKAVDGENSFKLLAKKPVENIGMQTGTEDGMGV